VPDWLLPHALSFAVPGVATLTVDVARANVSGLDSFTRFELLEPVPADAAGLFSAIDLDRLEVGLELRLSILGGGGPRQLPPLSVRFSLADVRVDATGRLALDADGIAAMQLNQLLNTSCLLREIQGASLDSLAAHLSLSTLAVDGAAWGGTPHAALPRPLHLSLPLLGGDLLSLLVSSWMADAVRRAQRGGCPAARHPPPPSSYNSAR